MFLGRDDIMNITIRPTTEEEAQLLSDIQKEAFLPLYEKYHDKASPYLRGKEDILNRINTTQFRCYCILSDDVIVGGIYYKCFGKCLFIEELKTGEYYLQRVFIKPQFQCKGIAQRAILLCEKEFPNAEKFIVDFPVDLDKNRKCYEKAGFCDTGKSIEIQPGLVLACYEKTLHSRVYGMEINMNIEIDLTNTIIETNRLILRPWRESDLNDMYEYDSVEGVGEMAGWKHHESIEESKKIIDSFINKKNVFAIVLKANNKVIGSLGLHQSWANDDPLYKDLKQIEIGYVLSKAYWGKGLTPEAVKAVIDYCFGTLELDALTVKHFQTNNQSRRVIEKCGFKFAKADVYDAKQLDREFDDMKYILLRDDWYKK